MYGKPKEFYGKSMEVYGHAWKCMEKSKFVKIYGNVWKINGNPMKIYETPLTNASATWHVPMECAHGMCSWRALMECVRMPLS